MLFQTYNYTFKKILLIKILISSVFLHSQIVNIETLRKEKDTVGWSGYGKLEFGLEKNRNNIFELSNELRVQYKGKKNTVFLIHELNFKDVNSVSIVHNTTQHLRFSHIISPKVSYEAFVQSQSDKISEIKLRMLVGTGFRFNLRQSEITNFFLGSTFMFEYENSTEEFGNDIHRDIRNSTYFSFKIYPNKNISIVSTNYFQPRMDMFSDYRILSETSLLFTIIKNLKFTTSFSYLYDSFPATSAVKEQYKLTNGLVYFFN